tara:strand:- start:89 stop:277 length:189 start_codon:yes stop_codon:yes gene_type:complete
MNNDIAIQAMMFLQVVAFLFVYEEKDKMLKDWKSWRIDKKIGRIFFLFIPFITIISLTINPL